MNALARLGLLVTIAGLAMTAALFVKAEGISALTKNVLLAPASEARIAQTLPAREVEIRISDPLVFNVSLAIYRDADAPAYLSGEGPAPAWEMTFHGPGTLLIDSHERGTYLFAFKNLDDRAVALAVSQHEKAGADRELLRIGETITAAGLVLGAGGLLLMGARRWSAKARRGRSEDAEP